MGFDAYGPTQRPTPPKPVTDGGWFGDLAARQRRDDRALERTTSVRATGRMTVATPLTNPDLGGVVVGGGVSVAFTPPDGGTFMVTTRLDVGDLPSDATISILARGISPGGGACTSTVQAGGTNASVSDVDAASVAAPITALCAWNASGSPDPVDFRLTFICVPF